jgi:hypothetical protein
MWDVLVAVFVTTLLLGADKTTIAVESFFNSNTDLTPNPFPCREGEPTSKPLSYKERGLERGPNP